MTPVVLIGCSASKLDRAAPARELYTGRVFRESVRYAEAIGARWFVLSALHGVVAPETVIEPYDVTLTKMPKGERRSWAGMVSEQIGDRFAEDTRFVVLAGKEYVAGCTSYGRASRFDAPLARLGTGARYARLVEMREEAERERSESRTLAEAGTWMRAAAAEDGEVMLSGPHLRAVLSAIGGAA